MKKGIIIACVLFMLLSFSIPARATDGVKEPLLGEQASVADFLQKEKFGGFANARMSDAIKAYDLTVLDVVSAYQSGKHISELIDETSRWLVPTEDGDIITVMEKSGQWKIIGAVIQDQKGTDLPQTVHKEKVSDLAKSVNAEKVTYIDVPYYQSVFAYFEKDGVEYVVPFSAYAERTGLKNGELYLADQAMQILGSNYFDSQTNQDGSGNKMATSSVRWILPTVGVCVLIAVSLFLIVKKRKGYKG